MKTNTILISIIIVALAIAGVVLTQTKGTQTVGETEVQSSSALVAERDRHDFGEIGIFDGTVETTFALSNEGSEAVVVTQGTTSCGCTSGELEGIGFGMHEGMREEVLIPAGATKELTVIYDPLAHGPSGTGLAQRSVLLQTNSSITPELEVRIRAMVVKDTQN